MGSYSEPDGRYPLAPGTCTFIVDVFADTISHSEIAASSSAVTHFLQQSFEDERTFVKLLLPVQSGYIIQSDFLERRMIDCPYVVKTEGFLQPGQKVKGVSADICQFADMKELLPYCYGAIRVQNEPFASATATVNAEMVNRLSFPWLSANAIRRRRLALVGAGSLSKFEGYLIAAASLNVGLVAFDEASHWLASNDFSHYREEFVPLDMTTDAQLVDRVVAKLEEYQSQNKGDRALEGLVTADEHLLSINANVAERLGFDTPPAKSVMMAQNKYQTRQLDTNVYCRLLQSPNDLERLLQEDGPRLQYPLIVKPSKGWSSEGVWKVNNEEELRHRVPLLWQDGFTAWHGNDVVIETFVEGPEVDANMVLVDGEITFFEANDDFPSTGDFIAGNESTGKGGAAPVANFVETSNSIPSVLPLKELRSLQNRLHELALAAGFRTAVLHMEARLRNSSHHYATVADSKSSIIVDLVSNPASTTTTTPSDVFLIEINPRAPGFQECDATAHAYGISYYSLSILRSCNDKERIRALSQPFLNGPQYHLRMELVAAERGGTYHYGDVCARILQEAPHLKMHLVRYASLMEEGQQVPNPKTGMVYGNFIAYFLVVSRKDRREAIRVGNEVRRLVREYTEHF